MIGLLPITAGVLLAWMIASYLDHRAVAAGIARFEREDPDRCAVCRFQEWSAYEGLPIRQRRHTCRELRGRGDMVPAIRAQEAVPVSAPAAAEHGIDR